MRLWYQAFRSHTARPISNDCGTYHFGLYKRYFLYMHTGGTPCVIEIDI